MVRFYLLLLILISSLSSCKVLTENQRKLIVAYADANKTFCEGVIETRKAITNLNQEDQLLNKANHFDSTKGTPSEYLKEAVETNISEDEFVIRYSGVFETLQSFSSLLKTLADKKYDSDWDDKTESLGENTDSIMSLYTNFTNQAHEQINLGFAVKALFDIGAKKAYKHRQYRIAKEAITKGSGAIDSIYKNYLNVNSYRDSRDQVLLSREFYSQYNAIATSDSDALYKASSAMSRYSDLFPLYIKLKSKNDRVAAITGANKQLASALISFFETLTDCFTNRLDDPTTKKEIHQLQDVSGEQKIHLQNLKN